MSTICIVYWFREDWDSQPFIAWLVFLPFTVSDQCTAEWKNSLPAAWFYMVLFWGRGAADAPTHLNGNWRHHLPIKLYKCDSVSPSSTTVSSPGKGESVWSRLEDQWIHSAVQSTVKSDCSFHNTPGFVSSQNPTCEAWTHKSTPPNDPLSTSLAD